MLRRRALALVVAAGLAATTAALLAIPVVVATTPPPCTAGVCYTPTPTGATITAVAAIPGLPPQVGRHTNSGTGWTAVTAPSCPPSVTYEPVGGSPGVYGWTDPGGVNHLAHGSPPSPGGWNLAEYWVDAEYSRTMTSYPACQPGPWLFVGFLPTPVTFPDPTTSTPGVTPAIKALEAEVEKNLVGGQVMTAPAVWGLVNLPEDAWVTNSTIPASLVKTTTVTYTPPGVGQREEVLTVAVALQRIGVVWSWGDGESTGAWGPGGMGQPYPYDNISHTYYLVSVPARPGAPSPYHTFNAAGEIPISSVQEMQISAYAIWRDANGRHQVELGSFPLAIPVRPHWINVGQIEGVPFCPTKTSCA